MKTLVFDTGSIISLVTNNLLEILKPLKEKFKGEFYLPRSVEYELVDKPIEGKMFKLEAMMVDSIIKDGTLTMYNQILNVESLLSKMNGIFLVNGKPLSIVSKAEVEALALAVALKSEAYVVDERTMRLLIEDPLRLRKIQENKLHTRVAVNKEFLKEFSNFVKNIKVIRSTELVLVAYELGILDRYLTTHSSRKELVDALLWGLKLRGCSISQEEVRTLVEMETKK